MKKFPAGAILAIFFSLSGCGGGEKPQAVELPEPVEVRLATVVQREVMTPLEITGTVRSRTSSSVSSRILSSIRTIHVDEGDAVRRGQSLVELDDRDLASGLRSAEAAQTQAESAIQIAEHNLESARAQLELAEVTFERFQQLLEKNSATRQEYDQASAGVRSARAAVEAAESQKAGAASSRARAEAGVASAQLSLGYARIHAPFAGVVTRRFADPGTLAVPGQPILQIEQTDAFWLEVPVPESLTESLRVGQEVPVAVDAIDSGDLRPSKVVQIVPEVDTASRTFLARLALPSRPGMRSGLHGRAFLPGQRRQILWVPAHSVVEQGQVRFVFVVDSETARMRIITVGAEVGDGYEVLSGLAAGEKLVALPGGGLDGAPVRTVEERSSLQAGAES